MGSLVPSLPRAKDANEATVWAVLHRTRHFYGSTHKLIKILKLQTWIVCSLVWLRHAR